MREGEKYVKRFEHENSKCKSKKENILYDEYRDKLVHSSTPDIKTPVRVSMPHYMFYAPYVTFSDVSCKPDAKGGLMLVNPDERVPGGGR